MKNGHQEILKRHGVSNVDDWILVRHLKARLRIAIARGESQGISRLKALTVLRTEWNEIPTRDFHAALKVGSIEVEFDSEEALQQLSGKLQALGFAFEIRDFSTCGYSVMQRKPSMAHVVEDQLESVLLSEAMIAAGVEIVNIAMLPGLIEEV
jgi:hypothetical protein